MVFKIVGSVAAAVISLFVAMMVIGAMLPQPSAEQSCLEAKGYGAWRGSSGVSLTTFCHALGAIQDHQAFCSREPERC